VTRHIRFSFLAALLLSLVPCAVWSAISEKPGEPAPAPAIPDQALLDPEIVSMLAQVDPGRVSSNIQTLAGFGTHNTCSDNSGALLGIGAARNWIQSQFAALPGLQVRLDPWTSGCCGSTRTLQNVIAWIPGSGHPDRLIVIGGHYDSRNTNALDGVNPAPGANDSGSQTALVLEAARVMAGHTFDTTIVFAAWSGEEQGLLGSAAFVQHYRNYFLKGTIEMNFNADIVGGDNTVNDGTALQRFRLFSPGTPREISSTVTGTTDDTSPSRGVMRYIGYWGGGYIPSMTMLPQLREDRPGRSGDHKSFISHSIPAVRFIDVNENLKHQHTPNDLFAYVTPDFTARVTQVVVASVSSLARAPTAPQNMVASGLSSTSTSISWSAPVSGPAVDHYVISARPYTENFYHTRFSVAGSATSANVTLTEDLGIVAGTPYYISVAAVDAAGHESLYAYSEYRCDSSNVCSRPSDALDVTAKK
jgi:acetylornithine deacetylase/succinyl-diaminopimelate desuccinylase-like protein